MVVFTPGAATAVVIRNVLARGHRGGFAAALGIACGNTLHAAVAGIGLLAMIQRTPLAQTVLRTAGSLYLLYLGLQAIAAGWKPAPGDASVGAFDESTRGERNAIAAARQGLVTSVLNPAVLAFYLAVVPTFLPQADPSRQRFALYAVIHVSMAFACHSAWTLGLTSLRAFWGRPTVRRLLETATGSALVYLAWRVAYS